MNHAHSLILGGLLGMAVSVPCAGADISPRTLVRLAPMTVKPEIDGKIKFREWEHASASFGTVSDKTGLMSTRTGTFLFGYDAETLYFAFSGETPPRPQKLFPDDTVTIAFQAPGKTEPTVFTFSSTGRGNLPSGARVAHWFGTELDRGIVHPHWHAEAAIPLKAFGVDSLKEGEPCGLQMSREWKHQDETGFWHFPARKGELGTFIPDSEAPAVSFHGFGHMLWDQTANYNFNYQVVNSGRKPLGIVSRSMMVADAIAGPTLTPGSTGDFIKQKFTYGIDPDRVIAVPAGSRIPVEATVWCLFPGIPRTLISDVVSTDGKKTFYRRAFAWNLSDKGNRKWEDVTGIPKLQSAFYPSSGNKLLVRVTGARQRKAYETTVETGGDLNSSFKNISVTVSDSKGAAVHVFRNLENSSGFLQSKVFGELPPGDYRCDLSAEEEKTGRIFTDRTTFSVRKFEWQNNRLGMDRVIIPPFVPLKTDQDKKEVHALQTGYRIANGFWDAVYAKGENILAAPVELLIDGEKFTPGETRLISAEKDRVVWESSMHWKKLSVTVVQDYDYDGFCKATLKFKPVGKVKFESLKLVMPLKKETAPYFNMFGFPREASESYRLPEGTGEIWNSSKATRKTSWAGFMQPYFWLGGIFRGFCWMTDSYQHYELESGRPSQRISRSDDAVTLEIDLVNRRTVWTPSKAFETVMGFQATPVKPQTVGFRKMNSVMYEDAWYPRNCRVFSTLCKLGLREGVFNPPEGDFSFFDYIMSIKDIPPAKRDKAEYQKRLNEYFEKHVDFKVRTGMDTPSSYRNDLNFHFSRAVGAQIMYVDPTAISCFWPEDEMYKAEWNPWTFPPVEPFYQEYLGRIPKSRIDKLLYDQRRAFQRGLAGSYFDCFDIGGGYNTETGIAWADEDGQVHPSGELFAWRELVRRTATMLYVMGKLEYGVPWVGVHTSLDMVVPVCSFASIAVACEKRGNLGDYQDRYRESEILADIIGTQAGIIPFTIVTTRKKDPTTELKSMLAMRFGFALMNLYDQSTALHNNPWARKALDIVYDFGYGDPDVEVLPFYGEKRQPVIQNGKNARMTVVKRPDGRTLLMFGNWGDAETVSCDLSGLKYGFCTVTDAESGKLLARTQEFKFPLERRGYRLILVEDKK